MQKGLNLNISDFFLPIFDIFNADFFEKIADFNPNYMAGLITTSYDLSENILYSYGFK